MANITVIFTPEEAEKIWTALANSVAKSTESERLRSLLWREMHKPKEEIIIKMFEAVDEQYHRENYPNEKPFWED